MGTLWSHLRRASTSNNIGSRLGRDDRPDTPRPVHAQSVFEKFLDLGRRVCVTMNVNAIERMTL
jgi:hypothetical protein